MGAPILTEICSDPRPRAMSSCGLMCKLFGTARNLDASYISIEVVTGAVPGFPASAKPPQRLWKRQCERIAAGRRT
eukprot:gene8469-4830_t